MNQQVKEKWVAALRSGEFRQTKEVLKNADGYCCLGVLSELHRREHPGKSDWFHYSDNTHGSCFLYGRAADDGSPFILTLDVIAWAELEEIDNPQVIYKEHTNMLSELNDGEEGPGTENRLPISFAQIAALIEEQL